jgi:hypothetical protein
VWRPAQVIDDALAHDRAQVALCKLAQPGQDGQEQEAQGQPVEAGDVPLGQRVVDQVAVEQRGDEV